MKSRKKLLKKRKKTNRQIQDYGNSVCRGQEKDMTFAQVRIVTERRLKDTTQKGVSGKKYNKFFFLIFIVYPYIYMYGNTKKM